VFSVRRRRTVAASSNACMGRAVARARRRPGRKHLRTASRGPTPARPLRRPRRARRDRAARKYRPAAVKLLLVAEAPPSSLDRYFYFEDVSTRDSLFRYIARAILKVEPTRATKPDLLAGLRDRGVFLIDLKREPVSDGRSSLVEEVPGLVRRARRLAPERIIVV
jgi:hypothetical protein